MRGRDGKLKPCGARGLSVCSCGFRTRLAWRMGKHKHYRIDYGGRSFDLVTAASKGRRG
jgi:hypothetical protein